jgi:NAD(P)-dependent dehydrogenase (short-subunit alcohol dehydrogenase family)
VTADARRAPPGAREGAALDRSLRATRLVLGTAYLTGSALAARHRSGPKALRMVAGILGARHLAQALLTADRPARAVIALGAEVDATHSATAIALGALSPRWRILAFADALLAGSLAAAGAASARKLPPGEPAGSGTLAGTRDQWAQSLARYLAPAWLSGAQSAQPATSGNTSNAERNDIMPARKVAVITGASAGVGRATVRAFADHGFDIGLLARGEAGLEAAAAEVEAAGGRALCLPADVSQFDQVDAAASRVEQELGPIDVWVNDAMTTVFAPTWDVKPADFQRAVEVTFLGQVWGTMAALNRMRPRDRGNIVNVGSALGIIGIPLQSAYCSSKFACRGFFESVRAELLHEGSGVQLSMVYLPAVNTPQFDWCATTLDRHPMPVPPIYQPELIAKFILETALTGRREKVIGSWNKILVMAGRLFPGLGNQYAALGAWSTQLTGEHIAADRPVNLYQPADAKEDHGAHGQFDHMAGGFLDPSFLKTLPTTAKTFATALARDLAGKRRRITLPPRPWPSVPLTQKR